MLLRTGIVILMALLMPQRAEAITEHKTKQQLCAETDLAVIGKVQGIQSYEHNGDGPVVSDVQFNVERVVEGSAPSAITVFALGGKIGASRTSVGGMPDFEVGERYFLLLHKTAEGELTIKMGGAGAVLLDPNAQLPTVEELANHWEANCGA